MGKSLRNIINHSSLDATESVLGQSARAYSRFQPFGAMIGKELVTPAGDLFGLGANWIYTEVGSGGTAGVIQAPSSTLPPVAGFATGASQHNNQQIQWARAQTASTTGAGTVTAYAPYLCKTGYSIGFRARLQITSTFANAAWFIGLAKVSTTVFSSSAASVSEMVGFYKAGGDAHILGLQRGASTNTTTTLADGTISTWVELEMEIVDRTSISFWVNGVLYGEGTVTNLPANTVALAPTFVLSASTAAIAAGQVQNLTAYQEAI